MTNFYFRLRDRHGVREALRVYKLSDLATAKNAALATARMINDLGMLGENPSLDEFSFEVCDEAGNVRLRIQFTKVDDTLEAMSIPPVDRQAGITSPTATGSKVCL